MPVIAQRDDAAVWAGREPGHRDHRAGNGLGPRPQDLAARVDRLDPAGRDLVAHRGQTACIHEARAAGGDGFEPRRRRAVGVLPDGGHVAVDAQERAQIRGTAGQHEATGVGRDGHQIVLALAAIGLLFCELAVGVGAHQPRVVAGGRVVVPGAGDLETAVAERCDRGKAPALSALGEVRRPVARAAGYARPGAAEVGGGARLAVVARAANRRGGGRAAVGRAGRDEARILGRRTLGRIATGRGVCTTGVGGYVVASADLAVAAPGIRLGGGGQRSGGQQAAATEHQDDSKHRGIAHGEAS